MSSAWDGLINDKTKTELKKTISRYHNIQWSSTYASFKKIVSNQFIL